MIAIDINIVVYARRAEAPHHAKAHSLLRTPAEGDRPWALPWPCACEYLRVVTHRAAMRQVLLSGPPTGNLVHDAHIAALLAKNGIREFWTADRDFARFPGLKVVHPFA